MLGFHAYAPKLFTSSLRHSANQQQHRSFKKQQLLFYLFHTVHYVSGEPAL